MKEVVPFFILADDLTGACDTGVMFARGKELTIGLGHLPEGNQVVVDGETRNQTPGEVKETLERICSPYRGKFPSGVFQKVDSTLRGPIVVTAAVLLELTRAEYVVFAPAFPKAGRTVEGGRLLVEGKPLAETPYFLDPAGAKTDSIPKILSAILEGAAVSSGEEGRNIFEMQGKKGRGIFGDVVTQEDLKEIVKLGLQKEKQGHRVLWIGSAGLGEELGKVWGEAEQHKEEKEKKAPWEKKGVLLALLGSRREIAEKQAAFGRDRGDRIETPESLLLPEELQGPEEEIAMKMARAFQKKVEAENPSGLFLSGGQTAAAFFQLCGIDELKAVREILPGLPLLRIGRGAETEYENLPVITKAGGFGKEDTVHEAMELLREFLKRDDGSS